MPFTTIRGARLNYEVLGSDGPWVALSPGGRRDMGGVRWLGERVSAAGHRVLLHDRRNCGASDVVIDGEESEYEIWADDLHELLAQLGTGPVYAGGASSGCRLSLLLALRHPRDVRGLLLWRITGGPFAAERLAENYYGQFIEQARRGGMAAVCGTEFFAERIEANPANRDHLLTMDPARFIGVMSRWREYFVQSAQLPVIGATDAELASIQVPACVVPGNDWTHPRRVGENAARLLPRAELQILLPQDRDVDLATEDWDQHQDELAALFVAFLGRHSAPAA
jgi:pimeloyl-ACP methyl ester carboxylesterase